MENEEVTTTPTAAGHFKVCCAVYAYRYQKGLAGGSHRWKCSSACKAIARRGFPQADTMDPGMRAIAQGARCDGCEPSPTTERVEATQRQIIR